MESDDRHAIDEIVENMASKLYFHGHPINRHEAKKDLKLKVAVELQPELESAIWNLYLDFEREFQNTSVFDPAGILHSQADPSAPTEVSLLHAAIESERLTSQHHTRHRYTPVPFVQPGQMPIPGLSLLGTMSYHKAGVIQRFHRLNHRPRCDRDTLWVFKGAGLFYGETGRERGSYFCGNTPSVEVNSPHGYYTQIHRLAVHFRLSYRHRSSKTSGCVEIAYPEQLVDGKGLLSVSANLRTTSNTADGFWMPKGAHSYAYMLWLSP